MPRSLIEQVSSWLAAGMSRLDTRPHRPATHSRLAVSRPPRTLLAIVASLVALAMTLTLNLPTLFAAELLARGERLFADRCAHCHGAKGEGTKELPERLEGDRSLADLAKVIGETMPEDDAGSLKPDEVEAVAAYIHESFYSAIARARNRPPRIELARLTVSQYRRAVADLIASFGQPQIEDGKQGLQGEYFDSRLPGARGAPVATRVDAQVAFDFGTEAPVPEITRHRSFSMRWSGSLIAPETGEYEFLVRTDHAARLWVNDSADRPPLIDAWVKSGDESEHKASLYLVGGRRYRIQLEFSKATQGVARKEEIKNEAPPVHSSITLLWRRAGRVVEVIPSQYLSPRVAAETFACNSPFPPDDRSYGWERGTAVSPEWDEATTAAAIATASYIADRSSELAGIQDQDDDVARMAKLREFCSKFAERAFRKPLDDRLKIEYIGRQFDEAASVNDAVQRVVLLVLKSPRFLFREIGAGPAGFDVAARLSFALWDSIPDRELRRAARSGRLSDSEQVRQVAEQMLADPRAMTKLREFLLTWLRADAPAELNKDRERFSEFDQACAADLRTSLELFLQSVLESDGADYRQLLLADEVLLNARLAKLYGVDVAPDAGFTAVKLDEGKRAGVITHPYIMARYAYSVETSPIHRGVFLARGVLGQSLRPPPEAFTPLPPELHPDMTTRERVTLQTKDAACMSCHSIINPLGFALERFDAVGRYRDSDRGHAIDDDAVYQPRSGDAVRVHGARELAEHLANSQECHAAFTEQLFHHLVQQPVQAYGPDVLQDLCQSFAANNFNIRKLAVEIMVATALTGRDTNDRGQ